jgi:pimeloyl-ACP methyl ester carboxylesterase
VKAPALILLHMRGGDKSTWGSLPEALLGEDFAVIAIDMRGHGQTVDPSGRQAALTQLTKSDYRGMLFDIGAAHAFLADQPDVDGERVGIIGASIGANLGVIYAASDRRVRTVVCLSAGLDYAGLTVLDYMEALDKRPLYLIVARGDKYSYESSAKIIETSAADGLKSMRAFDGKDHGTELLAAHPGLEQTIVTGWLLNYLPPTR